MTTTTRDTRPPRPPRLLLRDNPILLRPQSVIPAAQSPGDTHSSEHPGLAFILSPENLTTATTHATVAYSSFHPSVVTMPTSVPSPDFMMNEFTRRSEPVCIGHGLDASAQGMLSVVVLPSIVGLILWLIFAIVRPRFRQVYALREWFVPSDLRPKPLRSSIFAFLSPHVPLVPLVPADVSDSGHSTPNDAVLFPSDEQLTQRVLSTSLAVVFGWTILGLGGALPLYLVSTPCLAESNPPASFEGAYSTLQDLSLLRLLSLFENGTVSTQNLIASIHSRADPAEDIYHARVRVIVLTAVVLVLGVLPALWKIMSEFNSLVAYRRRWMDVKCESKELGWLSARSAPGFVGWGEKRLKDFMLKNGMSSSFGPKEVSNGVVHGARPRNGQKRTRRVDEQPLNSNEVDIQSLFSIGDTEHLALLIDERDEILENLEIAETRYIGSFQITTPDPSIADYEPRLPQDPNRPYISRPLPLNSTRTVRGRRRRAGNPAFAASSLAPTSFVAPSQYYKLRRVQGVSGGRFADSVIEEEPSLSASINSRIIGTRFQEVNRNSVAYGRLPLGSQLKVEKSGQLGPRESRPTYSWMTIPDPRQHGPNYGLLPNDVDEHGMQNGNVLGEDWVDLTRDAPIDFQSDSNGSPSARPSSSKRRSKKESVTGTKRETFPLRSDGRTEPDSVAPPHLRLQPTQPFVRPLDGINYDDLGHVYADITQWRSKLKEINGEIAEMQRESYSDIAEGIKIKGWLMVGRGLRFIPGIQLIEGRAKEDIRWDVLQHERSWFDSVLLFYVVGIVMILLAAGLTAASGLSLSLAPDVAHHLRFLGPLLTTETLASGIATILCPAVAATLFIGLALFIVNWTANVHGSISISGGHLLVFKTTFFILTATAIWIIAAGAVVFSIQAFNTGSEESVSIANGAIYMCAFALAVIINLAIIFPAFLVLQPFRLWRVTRAERRAVTPRQRFRAVYPRTYNPSFATGACILAIAFASSFAFIFPLIGPAVSILLFLTLIAHRYLVGYVYVRTHSQTGGILQIWLLKRLGSLLAFQPAFLGLIFLSRHFWIEGGVLLGSAAVIMIFVESYTTWKSRLPGRKSLSAIAQDSLTTFSSVAKAESRGDGDQESNSLMSSARGPRTRGSMASVLEMMSLTLAVMPSPSSYRGPVPLKTETLDDLTATERAARTHPDAPPHLPPLPFTDHAEDMAGILYAPELIAPPPIIWLPNDSAGVARSEAVDLQKYHDLQVTLDVRAKEDIMPQRSSSTRRHTSR